jgi:hypothetical protein
VLQAMTTWVALRWGMSANLHSRTKQVVFVSIVLVLWLSLYIYEMRRVHHLLKLQQLTLAPSAMRQRLRQMWRQASLATLLAFLIFGKLSLFRIEDQFQWSWEPTSLPLLLSLVCYWFYLTGWQLWEKRWEVMAHIQRKEGHDSSRIG